MMKKILTVDFDDTLAKSSYHASFDEYTLEPITRIIDFVKEKHKEGWEIHIVTFRHPQHKKEVEDFCKDYEIPITSVICTSSNPKTDTLLKLKSDLHIDDHVETLVLAKQAGVDVLMVDWNQEDFNSTAKYFDKI
jgi:sugar phosphate isomerase/epimerase